MKRFPAPWVAAAALAIVAGLALFFQPAWLEHLPAPVKRAGYAMGLGEGCLHCHADVTGLGGAHAPAKIGCASCHGGNARTREKAPAHEGMVLIPGNLADAARTCGQAGCHDAVLPRVQNSIMTTMAGVIAINRAVLGEKADPGAPLPHAGALGHGVADSHLRELCVGCHLGQAKAEWGPVNEESQGGGCLACHVEYDAKAAADLAAYVKTPRPARTASPATHPSLTVNPRNDHCFGCHSRSGRIVTSYEGWNEMKGEPPAADLAGPGAARFRKILDGRYFKRVTPDVHHEKGLECIDCHTSTEVMGAGAPVAFKRQQLRVGCEDCHTRTPAAIAADSLDPGSRRLLAARGAMPGPKERVGTTRDGEPLVNVVVAEDGTATLRRKRTGQAHPLKPPAAACTGDKGHARLSCSSCHTAWAPRCTTCHTQYDPKDEGFDHAAQQWVKGTWNETSGPFEAVPPALGVLTEPREGGLVETFVPGMVMTFDRNREPGGKPDVLFRRLHSKLFAHTIRREPRACVSCHNDPVALGFGRGELRFEAAGGRGRWTFRPAVKPAPQDGLPGDAWTGFLRTRDGMVSTRDSARPFDVAEQRRILTVGACLTCHAGDSPPMKAALADFAATAARRTPRCALPEWPGAVAR